MEKKNKLKIKRFTLYFNHHEEEKKFFSTRFFNSFNIRSLVVSGLTLQLVLFVALIITAILAWTSHTSYGSESTTGGPKYSSDSKADVIFSIVSTFRFLLLAVLLVVIFTLNCFFLVFKNCLQKAVTIKRVGEIVIYSLWLLFIMSSISIKSTDGVSTSPLLYMIKILFVFVQPRYVIGMIGMCLLFIYSCCVFTLYIVGIDWRPPGDEYREIFNFFLYFSLLLFYISLCLLINYSQEYIQRKSFMNEILIEQEEEKMRFETRITETYLKNVLPEMFINSIIDKVKNIQQKRDFKLILSQRFNDMILVFCDFEAFTTFCEANDSKIIINVVNEYFDKYDELCTKHQANRLSTIGDAYVASHWNEDDDLENFNDMIRFAQELLEFTQEKRKLNIRVGIASGECNAVLFGKKLLSFDVLGTVRIIVELMESNCPTNGIMVNSSVYLRTKDQFAYLKKRKKIIWNQKRMKGYVLDTNVKNEESSFSSLNNFVFGTPSSDKYSRNDEIFSPKKALSVSRKRSLLRLRSNSIFSTSSLSDFVENMSAKKIRKNWRSLSRKLSAASTSSSTTSVCSRKSSSRSSLVSGNTSIVETETISNLKRWLNNVFGVLNMKYMKKIASENTKNEGTFKYVMLGFIAVFFNLMFISQSFQQLNFKLFSKGVYVVWNIFMIAPVIFIISIVQFVISLLFLWKKIKGIRMYLYYSLLVSVCVSVTIYTLNHFPSAVMFSNDMLSWVFLYIFCDRFATLLTKYIVILLYFTIYFITRMVSGFLYYGYFGFFEIWPSLGIEFVINLFMNVLVILIDHYSSVDAFNKNRLLNKHTKMMKKEKDLNTMILLSVIPKSIYKKIQVNFSNCSRDVKGCICFVKVVNIYDMILKGEKDALERLNRVFCIFTKLTLKSHCTRVKCVQDYFMVTSGLDCKDDDGHHMLQLCFAFLRRINTFRKRRGDEEIEDDYVINEDNLKKQKKDMDINLKIGISFGTYISGLIGNNEFHFDVMGNIVNRASRLCNLSKCGMINVDGNFQKIISKKAPNWKEKRKMNVKGIGIMDTYLY